MQLTIDGTPQTFVPVRAFRAAHGLPDTFGVALFEPKDYAGLGSIERAGAALNEVRRRVLAAVPAALDPRAWLAFVPTLRDTFERALIDINDHVGLKEVEIGFAVAGLSDVCEALGWAALRAAAAHTPMPPFPAVYGAWLDSTVRISSTVHPYPHGAAVWHVRVVTHAYGRAGLVVALPDATAYVADAALGCPAEGFMAALLGELSMTIQPAN